MGVTGLGCGVAQLMADWPTCPRFPCKVWREGYLAGYEAGKADGAAEAYVAGYQAGFQAGMAAASDS
jgi:hypothetical protein